jgi:hypothetical protein
MSDQEITIASLIKTAADEAAKQESAPAEDSKEKKEEKKPEMKEEEKKDEVEKISHVLFNLADMLEKVADELPLDLAPVPGEQPKTQDKPIADHDISDGGKTNPNNTMVNDERDVPKETQEHLGQPKKPFVPVTPDPPAGVTSAPAKKVAAYLQNLQAEKLAAIAGEGVPAGDSGYDSNPEAAHDRSAELLNEVNQVGMTQASESSGLVDKNQQAIDDTKKDVAAPQKQDMAKLLDEPMQSKKTDKVLADALPMMEPKAEPKVASQTKEAKKKEPPTATLAQKGRAVGGGAGFLGGAATGVAKGKGLVSRATKGTLYGILGGAAGHTGGHYAGRALDVAKRKTAASKEQKRRAIGAGAGAAAGAGAGVGAGYGAKALGKALYKKKLPKIHPGKQFKAGRFLAHKVAPKLKRYGAAAAIPAAAAGYLAAKKGR